MLLSSSSLLFSIKIVVNSQLYLQITLSGQIWRNGVPRKLDSISISPLEVHYTVVSEKSCARTPVVDDSKTVRGLNALSTDILQKLSLVAGSPGYKADFSRISVDTMLHSEGGVFENRKPGRYKINKQIKKMTICCLIFHLRLSFITPKDQ